MVSGSWESPFCERHTDDLLALKGRLFSNLGRPQHLSKVDGQDGRGLKLGTTRLPSMEVLVNWYAAATGPAIQSADGLDASGRLLVFGEYD